jgi:serine/threonine protein kinase
MSSSSQERSPVELLADEFLARCKRGEKPTIKEYCDRHPDLADEIRDVFEAVLMVEDLRPGSDDTSDSSVASVRVAGKRLEHVGDYRIVAEIGRGGMGVVYEAEQQALGRRVALKVLPRTSAGDGSALIRFQREAKAAARMHHTNIVPVFDVGQDGENLYYAMQLIHGQGLDLVIDDLKRLRAQSTAGPAPDGIVAERSIAASLVAGQFEQENLALPGPDDSGATRAYEGSAPSSAVLPGQSEISTATSNRQAYFRSVAQIGVQTASALSYAHSRGIIHRDIKPGNLILDTTGNVWVTDFGLAKTGDGGVTHTGDVLGTIRYMSPERFRGQCDVRADVYALGMTLYEMLTLKPAYASGDRLKLIELIRQSEAASPRSIDARIPRDLETIVMKAIDKDVKRRYQSADEMGEDLQRFVNDEPIKARRIGPVERFGRWCRRNPAVASLTTAVLVIMVAATGLSTWQAAVATLARADLAKKNAELVDAQNRQQAQLAESYFHIGNVLAYFGEPTQALQEFTKALFVQQKLVDGNPTVTEFQIALTRHHDSIGEMLYRTGKPAEAVQEYQRARAIRQKVADANPAVTGFQIALAGSHNDIGRVLSDTGKSAEALQEYQKARDIRQKVADRNPEATDFQRELAKSHYPIARVLYRLGKPVEALQQYQKALVIQQELAANPRLAVIQLPPMVSLELSWSHCLIGQAHAREKQFREAFAALDQGLAIRQKLADANPTMEQYMNELGYSHAYRGWAHVRAGHPAEAAADLRRALALWDKGKAADREMRFERSRALALLAGLAADGKSGVTAAEATAFANQAVATLRNAIRAGWRNVAELKEPDFNAIRGRDDFKKLVPELK